MKYANERSIWLNARDEFSHPYTLQEAERFIDRASSSTNSLYLAIANESEAVGSITLRIYDDIRRYNLSDRPLTLRVS